MGKDSSAKSAGGKGKGKAAAGGGDENIGGKRKGKGGVGKADGLRTCTYVKARHILSEKQGKINEACKKLQDCWLSNADKVPLAEFAKVLGFSLLCYVMWFKTVKSLSSFCNIYSHVKNAFRIVVVSGLGFVGWFFRSISKTSSFVKNSTLLTSYV